jgi:hypothetical protein
MSENTETNPEKGLPENFLNCWIFLRNGKSLEHIIFVYIPKFTPSLSQFLISKNFHNEMTETWKSKCDFFITDMYKSICKFYPDNEDLKSLILEIMNSLISENREYIKLYHLSTFNITNNGLVIEKTYDGDDS